MLTSTSFALETSTYGEDASQKISLRPCSAVHFFNRATNSKKSHVNLEFISYIYQKYRLKITCVRNV